MIRHFLTMSLAAAALVGCQASDDSAGNGAAPANGSAEANSGGGNRATSTIAQTAGQTAELSQFAQAIQAAGLAETFGGSIPYTVFAPVNAAFGAVPAETRTRLMAAEGREQLTQLLNYHVVPGVVT